MKCDNCEFFIVLYNAKTLEWELFCSKEDGCDIE